jgi:3-hydroxybutyryl-CoA dehydrogenase
VNPIEKITVIGAGTMGAGIAHVAAYSGFSVRLLDIDRGAVDAGIAHVSKTLAKGIALDKVTETHANETLARIQGVTETLEAVADADLVIEAIPENMELKKMLFQDLSTMMRDDAILATNTSSLSVTELASAAPHPDRVVGMHFFNPPHILTLLELVRAWQTSEETVAAVHAAGERMERDMIIVHDSPGFATSRLGLILGLEAMRMVQAGVATVEDIDAAMTLGYRHPMGPLKLTDHVGLDVRLAIAEHLHREIGEQFRPPQILRQLVRAGKLGKKTGEGFYDWR